MGNVVQSTSWFGMYASGSKSSADDGRKDSKDRAPRKRSMSTGDVSPPPTGSGGRALPVLKNSQSPRGYPYSSSGQESDDAMPSPADLSDLYRSKSERSGRMPLYFWSRRRSEPSIGF